MTTRATFGDFVYSVDQQMGLAAGSHHLPMTENAAPDEAMQVQEITAALRRVVAVMARYAMDAAGVHAPRQQEPQLTAWGRACIDMPEALQNADAILRAAVPGTRWPARPSATGPFARRLESVASLLTTAHDLLATHFATRPDGGRHGRSDWAPVITSAPVRHAVLAEIGSLAGLIASQCTRTAAWCDSGPQDSEWIKRDLNAACQWLCVANAAVQLANLSDPVLDDARDLLLAVPATALPPRALPRGGEPVAELCDGTMTSAQRVRHATRTLARDASWSPATSAKSLRHAAAASTATSYHCEILLSSLAACKSMQRCKEEHEQMLESASAISRTRAAWLSAAHVWDTMLIDAPRVLSHAAAESSDLALWTGRLAFADPEWTLSRGPSRAIRTPGNLAAEPDDIPRIVAAVHQATETMTRLARAGYRQIEAAAQAGRLFVPISSMPECYDIPHPLTRAPASRVSAALATYDATYLASSEAITGLDALAATVRSPSRLLTSARNVVSTSRSVARSPRPQPMRPNTALIRPADATTHPDANLTSSQPWARPAPSPSTTARQMEPELEP